jgi:SAM-dependent methyltransferase
MAADTHAAADFYATPRGMVAGRLLRERIMQLWPELNGLSVLGVGFPEPYLRLWRDRTTRCIAVTPAQMGATRWPVGEPNLSCTAEEDALPFPDLIFDRVLLVHGLEAAESARHMLREIWRVLKDDGRLLVVAPNRSGMWAYWESTPFGHGQPYSFGQIGRLLAGSLYRVERRDTALYFPPSSRRLLLRGAQLMERTGRKWVPGLAGVTMTEAVKDMYAAVPVREAPRRRLVLAEAA